MSEERVTHIDGDSSYELLFRATLDHLERDIKFYGKDVKMGRDIVLIYNGERITQVAGEGLVETAIRVRETLLALQRKKKLEAV
jgi:hypothetical protein